MDKIEKIHAIYMPLNKWLRAMCLKQRKVLPDGCLTPDGLMNDCAECRYRNNFYIKGTWG